MGRDAPNWKWPPRSPDLNPCDFFLWEAIKEKVYFDHIETVEDLEDQIEAAFASVEHVLRATGSSTRGPCVHRIGWWPVPTSTTLKNKKKYIFNIK